MVWLIKIYQQSIGLKVNAQIVKTTCMKEESAALKQIEEQRARVDEIIQKAL